MMDLRILTVGQLVLVITALAGCGGSATGTETPSYIAASQTAAALFERTSQLSVSAGDDVPNTGRVAYTGSAILVADVSSSLNETMYGTVTIDVGFSGGTFSGRVSEFEGQTQGAISGALEMRAGTFSGGELSAILAGELDGSFGAIGVDAQLVGDFLGSAAESIEAQAVGTTSTTQGSVGNILVTLAAEAE